MDLTGQWMGEILGESPGTLIIDFDRRENFYDGSALVFPNDAALPPTIARIRGLTEDKFGEFAVSIAPIHPVDRRILSIRDMKLIYPDVEHAETATVSISLENGRVEVKFTTPIGTSGSAILNQSRAGTPSDYIPDPNINTWDKFRNFVGGMPSYQFMFRGQSINKRLRTTFHRSGRSDLDHYIVRDIPVLHRALTPQLSHHFDLTSSEQLIAFYSLIQHHGFPTPLLDWSHSPFIAAFFAFRFPTLRVEDNIRIFLFDRKGWCETVPQFDALAYAMPHLSVIELPGIENRRVVPQQALSTVTNVDDIETYIRYVESQAKRQFLFVIDLPSSDRHKALNELSMMGITSGSLFPGLDGTCEQLRNRLFGYG